MRLFEITRNYPGWNVREYQDSFNDEVCVYRGDLSPIPSRQKAVSTLRRLYPGCKIRVENNFFKVQLRKYIGEGMYGPWKTLRRFDSARQAMLWYNGMDHKFAHQKRLINPSGLQISICDMV